jgi:hypothetical protein
MRRLGLQRREMLTMDAHLAAPASRVAGVGIRHLPVRGRFDGVAIREGGEVRRELRLIAGRGAGHQLPHLDGGEHRIVAALRADDGAGRRDEREGG